MKAKGSHITHNVSGIAEGRELELLNFQYSTNDKRNYNR